MKKAISIDIINFGLIKEYGAISIEIIQTDKPKIEEYNKLMEYNDKHKEYTPLNRSIPTIRS